MKPVKGSGGNKTFDILFQKNKLSATKEAFQSLLPPPLSQPSNWDLMIFV